MSQQLTIAFVLFAVACCFTPGPNNAMLLTSGLNFGFRRTLPHVLGVTFGYGFLVAVMGLGLGAIFSAYPTLYTALKYVGAAYLLYLAWAIAMSGGIDDKGEKRGRPMSFLGGAVFQWVNVKGLIMSIGAVTDLFGDRALSLQHHRAEPDLHADRVLFLGELDPVRDRPARPAVDPARGPHLQRDHGVAAGRLALSGAVRGLMMLCALDKMLYRQRRNRNPGQPGLSENT